MAMIVMTLAVPDTTGAALVGLEYAKGWTAAGHEVALAYGPLKAERSMAQRGTIVDSFTALGAPTAYVPALGRPMGARADGAVAAFARKVGAAAIVGVQQRDRVVALRAADALGLPGVITLQNLHHFWGNPLLRSVKRHYYTHHLRRLTTVAVCCSRQVLEEAHARLGLEHERLRLVWNCVGPGQPVSAAEAMARREEFDAADRLLVTTVGRVDYQKGYDLLLQAIARLAPEWRDRLRVVVVGGTTRGARSASADRYRAQLMESATTLGVDDVVTFAGFRSDVDQILAASDVYVQPSRWEGFPIAVLEAMRAGLPLVISSAAGQPDHFNVGEHGLVVPTGDVEALASALRDLLTMSTEERRQMGARNRELVAGHYRLDDQRAGFVRAVEAALTIGRGRHVAG